MDEFMRGFISGAGVVSAVCSAGVACWAYWDNKHSLAMIRQARQMLDLAKEELQKAIALRHEGERYKLDLDQFPSYPIPADPGAIVPENVRSAAVPLTTFRVRGFTSAAYEIVQLLEVIGRLLKVRQATSAANAKIGTIILEQVHPDERQALSVFVQNHPGSKIQLEFVDPPYPPSDQPRPA